MVSGAGMLDFESCQSLEKLVLDNEICGMALHLSEGISEVGGSYGFEEISQYAAGGDFLKSPMTRQWYRSQQYFPSYVIERSAGGSSQGGDALARAHRRVEELLSQESNLLQGKPAEDLAELMNVEAARYGLGKLSI